MSKEEARGVLKSYLENEGLLEPNEDQDRIQFTYENPNERNPDGIFDYILQTIVDFHSDNYFGEKDCLDFDPEEQPVTRKAIMSSINLSELVDNIMDIYGFEIENPYERQNLGNAFTYFVEQIDQIEKTEVGEEVRITKAVGEDEIISTLESEF